jgi:chromosome segregation ATPase
LRNKLILPALVTCLAMILCSGCAALKVAQTELRYKDQQLGELKFRLDQAEQENTQNEVALHDAEKELVRAAADAAAQRERANGLEQQVGALTEQIRRMDERWAAELERLWKLKKASSRGFDQMIAYLQEKGFLVKVVGCGDCDENGQGQ